MDTATHEEDITAYEDLSWEQQQRIDYLFNLGKIRGAIRKQNLCDRPSFARTANKLHRFASPIADFLTEDFTDFPEKEAMGSVIFHYVRRHSSAIAADLWLELSPDECLGAISPRRIRFQPLFVGRLVGGWVQDAIYEKLSDIAPLLRNGDCDFDMDEFREDVLESMDFGPVEDFVKSVLEQRNQETN